MQAVWETNDGLLGHGWSAARADCRTTCKRRRRDVVTELRYSDGIALLDRLARLDIRELLHERVDRLVDVQARRLVQLDPAVHRRDSAAYRRFDVVNDR
jgi:hypothetical protein